MNYALLLSGGTGNRINSHIPKQYIKAGGMMMVSRTFTSLAGCPYIDKLMIIADRRWWDEISGEIAGLKLDTDKLMGFADPGRNRQESVYNGLLGIVKAGEDDAIARQTKAEDQRDTVLIHDETLYK